MNTPRIFRKQTANTEFSTGDYLALSIELTVDQVNGVGVSFRHFGDVADHLAATTHTLFGALPGKPNAKGETTQLEAYLSPDEFVEFVAAINALAAQLPDMINATGYDKT